jgi:hypothetical protein
VSWRNLIPGFFVLTTGVGEMSGKMLAEEYRPAAEAYRMEALRCPRPEERACLEAEGTVMEGALFKFDKGRPLDGR